MKKKDSKKKKESKDKKVKEESKNKPEESELEEQIEEDEIDAQDFFQPQLQIPIETTSRLERIQVSDNLEEDVASVPIQSKDPSKKYEGSKYDSKYGEEDYGKKTPDYTPGSSTEKKEESKTEG